jgi:hypothetical protein
MRLCAGQSGTTLDILHIERRAADHSANIGSRAQSEGVAMGAWGVGLYCSDFALDLRSCVKAVARLPFDPAGLLDTISKAEPSRRLLSRQPSRFGHGKRIGDPR